MQFCKAMVLFFLFQVSALFVSINGQCSSDDDPLPSIANAYRSDSSQLTLDSQNLVYGQYEIKCRPGYTLDPPDSNIIQCLTSGSWSEPSPQCISTGRCSMTDLSTHMSGGGINYDNSKFFLYTDEKDTDQVFGGSNVTVYCSDQYQNVGGSLTIVCTQDNSWTPFPQCTLIAARCPVATDTWTFPNGHLSNSDNLSIYDDNTAEGSTVVSCNPGFAVDSASNGLYACNGGTWSSRPYCTKTARCAPSKIDNFVKNTAASNGVRLAARGSNLVQGEKDVVLAGSYALFACRGGYSNPIGNLNVTCTADSQWSSFPSCAANSS